jgi:predicted RNase H-like HicB family nuclease
MNINTHQIIEGEKMKTYIFKVVLEENPFEDGRMAYYVFCPALKRANTWGYTKEEALKNIREVVEMTIESMIEHKEKIPETPKEIQIFSEPKVAVIV